MKKRYRFFWSIAYPGEGYFHEITPHTINLTMFYVTSGITVAMPCIDDHRKSVIEKI